MRSLLGCDFLKGVIYFLSVWLWKLVEESRLQLKCCSERWRASFHFAHFVFHFPFSLFYFRGNHFTNILPWMSLTSIVLLELWFVSFVCAFPQLFLNRNDWSTVQVYIYNMPQIIFQEKLFVVKYWRKTIGHVLELLIVRCLPMWRSAIISWIVINMSF